MEFLFPRDGAPRNTPDIEPSKLVSRGHFRNQIMCMTTQGTIAVPSAWPTPGTFNPKCFFSGVKYHCFVLSQIFRLCQTKINCMSSLGLAGLSKQICDFSRD